MERTKNPVQRTGLAICLILVLALGLAGCDADRVKELQAVNAELQRQLHEQGAARQAEIRYHERQASVALGCAALFDLCPTEMTEPGRQALERGYAGSLAWPFWLMLALKLVSVGAAIGGVLGGLGVIWIHAGRPARDTVARELDVLERGQLARDLEAQLAAAAEHRLRVIHNQVEHVSDELSQLAQQRAEMQTQIAARTQELASLSAAIQSARTMDL
jgi:hypothetical protein